MSLIQRKPRPLTRDSSGFRDDRLFIVACDDTYAPQQYFNLFQIPRVKIFVVNTPAGEPSSSEYVLERLLAYKEYEERDERWLLLDTDHYIGDSHIATFSQTLAKARQNNITIAVSRPCFDLWLLLHHMDETSVPALQNAGEVEMKIRSVVGEFNKTNLKKEHYPIEAITEAYRRAARLDQGMTADIPSGNSTRVYRLLKSIMNKSLASQLPSFLAELHAEIQRESIVNG